MFENLSEMEIIFRIIAALIAGCIIGYERERKGKSAGFVTITLVCIGAASLAGIQSLIVSSVSQGDSLIRVDPTRLIAQIVTGVGFLGAGSIIQQRGHVKGITTAATIWVSSSIGITFGMGFYILGTFMTLLTYFSILFLKKFEEKILLKKVKTSLYIEYFKENYFLDSIESYLDKRYIKILKLYVLDEYNDEGSTIQRVEVKLLIPRSVSKDEFIKHLYSFKEVLKIKVL